MEAGTRSILFPPIGQRSVSIELGDYMREAVCDFTAQIVDVLYAVTIILRDCRTIWLRPLTLVACFAMLLITVSPQLYAQVAPPLLHQTNLYTLLPDGTKSLSLMLNQPIGIDFEFDVGVCRGCGTFDGSNGLMYGYYLFKAQWPGASSVSTFGNTGCQWWDGGQPIESGYYTSYAYFSTPGTKSVTFSVTPCTAGALGASKTVTFKIGPGLVDPGAAALLPGSTKVISTPDDVVLNSRPIMGVSADGVSLALLEIPMANVGDSVTPK